MREQTTIRLPVELKVYNTSDTAGVASRVRSDVQSNRYDGYFLTDFSHLAERSKAKMLTAVTTAFID